MSSSVVFHDDGMPSRGLLTDLIMLIMQPVSFFAALGRKPSSHTLWVALLILAVLIFNSLQNPVGMSGQASVDMPAVSGFPGEGMPFDPGFSLDGGEGASAATDPSAQWMNAISAAATQILQWLVLALLLMEVPVFNKRRPQFNKNIQIVVWASFPLALMAMLQSIFIAAGGSIAHAGFSGFLEDWAAFSFLNIRAQSLIHALASELTLFWLWSLYLIYLGARKTLRGKQSVVLLVLISWVMMLGIVNSFKSYAMLQDKLPPVEETMGEEFPADSEILPNDGRAEELSGEEISDDETVDSGSEMR